MEALVSHTVTNLTVLVLAIYVGYHVVWNVTPALHTPLMAVTNAISAIVIVGAMPAAVQTETLLGRSVGVLAVALAAVNVFGGFMVTRRMLAMFKKKSKTAIAGRDEMSPNIVAVLYLLASVCFIQALKGLSHPTTSIRGNLFGMSGMAMAVLTTLAVIVEHIRDTPTLIGWAIVALVVSGAIGTTMARRVEMTKMPELVAFMHSMIGLAAVLVAIAEVAEPWAFGVVGKGEPLAAGNRVELALGLFIGAVTFTGSVIAFGKLSGKYKVRLFQGSPVRFGGQHQINLVLALTAIYFCYDFVATQDWIGMLMMLATGLALGVLLIIPIGGADMPVVVSMLNSYSGWAAAGIGFSLGNSMLIIAGSLVGSSGAILSYIMCRALNRSFFSVILGGFGAAADAQGTPASPQRSVKSGSADDAAFVLGNAESVVIVPGYGLAVARAQHAVKEMAQKLTEKGVNVKYAIHPVAGRMPGHMNVLLAEAEVPYDQVFEMEDINSEFGHADVAIVLGANDVVNPAALQKGSPIFGMPILDAYKAKTVIVNKRSMAAGYAGLDNELFYMEKSMMVFGDAKKVVEDIVKSID
ncbi:NAD(P)(+) transhydrogenase (Re/Si-specific) subunit beta [Paraburkholderia sp. BCC1884]|uniref:NAD(P)(+) transhydrogenase (Re/Si-specific) subunit beta n=1 Tax=Paraburkholderia sp. BCC1884 TaxID=2562668 RepID=UPI001183A94F|nr:NAD(P)(+) transhydrogenase (Re/Si-specific) subunit beta [Paraburkholderia sp. BCC1884]